MNIIILRNSENFQFITNINCILGVPEKEAKSFVGSHWTMKVGFQDQKLWCKLDCEEFPTLNMFMSSLEEGKEYCIPDKGFGKSSIVFNSIPGKPNMVHTVENTERYGIYEVIETYCEEGIKMVKSNIIFILNALQL